MAGEEAMQAIRNLGELNEMVNPMIETANTLRDQRKKTYDSLTRLRDMARQFLSTYEGNRANLENLYRNIQREAGDSRLKQQESLNLLSEILQQALADPTKDAVNELISDVDRLIEQMERNPQPSPPAVTGADAQNRGAMLDRNIHPTDVGAHQRLTAWGSLSPLNTSGNVPRPGQTGTNTRQGGRRKKIRSIKRGGYSWRTPSPNKSRKKTIKKTRTRQN